MSFFVKKKDVGKQKIHNYILAICEIMIVAFWVNNKEEKVKFF